MPVFYLFDGSMLIGEVQTTAQNSPAPVQAVYTWGANGLVSERLFDASGNGRNLLYAYDGQGATRELTDSTGTIVDTYEYAPYGTLLRQSGTDVNSIFQGAGGYGVMD